MTSARPSTQEVWTIPNAISMLRIVLIGVFMFLLISHRDGWAIAVLAAAGISDFFDGYLARRWQQVTTLGRILDPAADRLLTVAVVVGLALRGVVPWWMVVVILARDLMVALALLWARKHAVSTPDVTFLGKAATLGLYVFLPLAYLAFEYWEAAHIPALVGVVIAAGAYWWSGLGYVRDVSHRIRS